MADRLRALWPMALALAFAAAMFALAAPHALGAPWIAGLLAVLAIVWVALQPVSTSRDDTLPALAIVIAALGVLLVARLSPDLAAKQMLWLGFSLVLAIAA